MRDVFTLQIGGAFSHLLSFLKSIAFARLLGLESFGVYATVIALVGTLKIFTGFGHEQALITYMAEEYRERNPQGMRAVLKYYCSMILLTEIALLILAWISPALAGIFYPDNAQSIGLMARIGFVAFLVSWQRPLVITLLQTARKIRLLTGLENLNTAMQLGLGIAFILLGFGPLGIFLGLLVSNIIMAVLHAVLFLYLRKQQSLPGLRESCFSSLPIGQYVRQGLWIAVDKNIVNAFPQALVFIFSLYASAATVGIAQLAMKISHLPAGLFFGHAVRMANTVLPTMKSKGVSYLRTQCALLVKHALVFHALVVFGCMISFPFLVIIFYGWEFAGVITPMLWMLMIRLLQPFNVANTSIMRIFRKVYVSTIWNTIRIPLELGIFVLLMQWTLPMTAFVIAVLLHQLGAFSMNWYVYGVLLRDRSFPRK